jgi:rhodanese-related sulfurtransferase
MRRALLIVIAGTLLGLGVNVVSPRRIPWRRAPRVALPATDLISLENARRLWESGDCIFLDARPSNAFVAGHIAGSLSLSVDNFEAAFPVVRPRLATEQALVLYCDGERCDDSSRLLLRLRPLGFTNLHVLVNGWTLWQRAQLPTAKGAME